MKEEEIIRLSSPLSDHAPAGENLEYDPRMTALEEGIAGEPERIMGDSVIPAAPPDWRKIEKDSFALMRESRDIRIAVIWTVARLANSGVGGLREGLTLILRLCRQMWDTAWPVPDDGDVQERISSLMLLSPLPGSFDADTTVLHLLLDVPLTTSAVLGRYSLKDWHDVREGSEASRTITAALCDTGAEATAALTGEVEGCLDAIRQIRDSFTEHNRSAPDFRMLTDLLKEMQLFLNTAVSAAGDEQTSKVDEPAPSLTSAGEHTQTETPVIHQPDKSSASACSTEIFSTRMICSADARTGRREAIQLMQQVCDWFEENEPSSPVPFFLQRAIRLVGANFMDIAAELAPSSMEQLRTVLKPEEPSPGTSGSKAPQSAVPVAPADQPPPAETSSDGYFSPFG